MVKKDEATEGCGGARAQEDLKTGSAKCLWCCTEAVAYMTVLTLCIQEVIDLGICLLFVFFTYTFLPEFVGTWHSFIAYGWKSKLMLALT